MWLLCAETTKQVEVLFGVEILGDPRYIVLDGGPSPPAVRRRGNAGNFVYCEV